MHQCFVLLSDLSSLHNYIDLFHFLHSYQNVHIPGENFDLYLDYAFHVNLAVEWVIIAVLFGVQSITFSLKCFSNSGFCLVGLLQLFLTECSNNLFIVKIADNICSWDSYFFTLLITMTSPEQFCVFPSAKIFLHFDILTWSPTVSVGSLLFFPTPYSIYVLNWTSAVFILNVLWISSSLTIHTFIDTADIYLQILVSRVLMNLCATTDFNLISVE